MDDSKEAKESVSEEELPDMQDIIEKYNFLLTTEGTKTIEEYEFIFTQYIKIIKELEDCVKISCQNGNWNYDPYMHGLANGLILAEAIIKKKQVFFLEAPTKWISDIDTDKPLVNPIICSSVGSKLVH